MSAEVRTRMSISGRYMKGRSPEQLANVHLREVLSADRLVGSGNPSAEAASAKQTKIAACPALAK